MYAVSRDAVTATRCSHQKIGSTYVSELAYLHYTACNIGNLVKTDTETTYLLNIVLLPGPFLRHLRRNIPETTAGKKNSKLNLGIEK